ncbi:hypothetical protein APHAL10511_008662 [Amanita phalloides]|nr:hypothetical protein APHAL10511_008662 [Amanita phalloides]
MGAELGLFVFVIGIQSKSASWIGMENSNTVRDLKEAILKDYPNGLNGVNADQLTLYKVELPGSDHIEQLALQVRKEELPSCELSEVFPVQPPEDAISILVDFKGIVSSECPSKQPRLNNSPLRAPPAKMAGKLRLFVYVIGLRTSSFPVIIESSKTVGELKRAILKEKPIGLKGVHAGQLTLYKVELPDGENIERLEPLARKEELEVPSCKLSEVFPVEPREETVSILLDIKDIHRLSKQPRLNTSPPHTPPAQIKVRTGEIFNAPHGKLVYVEATGLGISSYPVVIGSSETVELKKAILEANMNKLKGIDADQLTLYKHDPWGSQPQKEELKVPSRILSKLKPPNTISITILVDIEDIHLLPPISLLYKGFGHFQDIFQQGEMHDRELVLAVDSFAEKMVAPYLTDAEKREEGLRCLNEILSLRGHKELVPDFIDDVHSDGHFNGPHGAVSFAVQFQNEFTSDNTSNPMVDLTRYVTSSHDRAIELSQKALQGRKVPCLGLTVVGSSVTFYAIIFLRQWCIVSLTPTLSCTLSACEGRDRKDLYAAFSGALEALDHFNADAKRVTGAPCMDELPNLDYKFPYVSVLSMYDAPNREIEFQIVERRPDTTNCCYLYTAILLPFHVQILVKFTKRYSIELYTFGTRFVRHPPLILGFGHIPGGWSVIVMEYMSRAVCHYEPAPTPLLTGYLCDQWADDFQTLMQSLDGKGLVRGGPRKPSMISHGERVMLIDFDRGGGEA